MTRPEHAYRAVQDDKYAHLYRAECACGWRAAGFARPQVAAMFYAQHIRDVRGSGSRAAGGPR